MKTLTLITVYICTFIFVFLMLSAIGILWMTYGEAISNGNWFVAYALFIGWWVALFPSREYYMNNVDYFERVF